MASTTDRDTHVVRNNRRTRWFHAGVYVPVIGLLLTGWWLWTGQEGRPSVLARATGLSDTDLHTYLGWALAVVTGIGVVVGWRAARTLIRDSISYRGGDLAWFANWPRALVTGRFGRHEGHFDPGQRIANLVMICLLLALITSGIGLVAVSGGPAFVWFGRIHRWATYLFTPVVAGHILVASGILPGYRGVWRSMHLGGRLRERDAARVWPAWLAGTRGRRQDEPPEG
ncbi:MAG TPA: cytochrome b/b6 domain-containing protein [Jiangellales bacterium]|nr:cytochrome b/b6 domain-containing protein [Jiangellales bacterium]